MSKKINKNEELEIDDEIEEVEKKKKAKKKLTANDKRKIVMKIAGWIMALAMLIGAIATIVGPLVYS